MQKSVIVLIYFLLLHSVLLFGQANKCNRETLFPADKQNFPKEVCIPKGHIISFVYTTAQEPVDFNQDGLNDYIFTSRKKLRIIGDSVFIHFYKRKADSSFTLVKKFGNIYPVKFDIDKSSPKFNDKKLDSIFNCYIYPYPLNSLEIIKDSVVIIKNLDMSANLGYYYKFNSKLDDWILVDKEIFIMDNVTSMPFKKGALLSDFSYCTDTP